MPDRKKVLIISYYWPPSGGPGVQRVLKFAKYLPEFGWTPVILTVARGEYPAVDQSLIKEISKECIVYKTPTLEFYGWYKWLTGKSKKDRIETYVLSRQEDISLLQKTFNWIRLNFFIPDARIGWLPFAKHYGRKILKKEKPDIIFSTSPPQTAQLIARWLARKSGIPLVADFRDPWMNAFYDQGMDRTFWARWINKRMESKVLNRATAITTVSQGYKTLMNGDNDPRFNVITNGFDAEDFNVAGKNSVKSSAFSIAYSGHLSPLQNPENFWDALRRVADGGRKLELNIYGYIDESVVNSIERNGISHLVKQRGYVAHDRLIRELMRADLLLLLLPKKHNKGMISAKLYEYLATGKNILTIGDPESDAAKILEKCNACPVYRYDKDLGEVLRQKIQDWEMGIPSQVDTEKIQMYTRKKLTEKLAGIFDNIYNRGSQSSTKSYTKFHNVSSFSSRISDLK